MDDPNAVEQAFATSNSEKNKLLKKNKFFNEVKFCILLYSMIKSFYN